MLGCLADIEVAVRIQASNRAVVVDCDSKLHVFVAMVWSFAIEVCQNGPVQADFLTRKRRREFDEGDGPALRSA
jgi:hypothetical protein